MDKLEILQGKLDRNGIIYISAKELSQRGDLPDEELFDNIIPTAKLVQHIRQEMRRFYPDLDLRIKIISGYRKYGTGNNSPNHGELFAIDFALWLEKKIWKTEELAKILFNYFLEYKKKWDMGIGYYPIWRKGSHNFCHVDLMQWENKNRLSLS